MKKTFKQELKSNRKIVITDGLVGGGKSLLANLVSSLPNLDQWIHSSCFEQICALNYLGETSLNTSSSLIVKRHNETFWDNIILRNSNFRRSDDSSITNHIRYKKIFKRMKLADHKAYLKYKNKVNIQYMTHASSHFAEPLFKAFGKKLIFLSLLRSPLNIYILNHLSNWTDRWKKIKTRSSMITYYDHKNKENIPFLVKNINEYIKSNKYERAIIILEKSLRSEKKLKSLSKKYNSFVIIIPYENLIRFPEKYLKVISTRLNTKIDKVVLKNIKKNKLPRLFIEDAPKHVLKGFFNKKMPKNYNKIKTKDYNKYFKTAEKFIQRKVRVGFFKRLIKLNNYYLNEILRNY